MTALFYDLLKPAGRSISLLAAFVHAEHEERGGGAAIIARPAPLDSILTYGGQGMNPAELLN
jgi:hypothetical protein